MKVKNKIFFYQKQQGKECLLMAISPLVGFLHQVKSAQLKITQYPTLF